MCNYIIRATSYTYTAGSSLVINTTSSAAILYNGASYVLCLYPELPSMSTVVPVYINVNGTNIPLQDVIGNTLQSDQIHPGRKYELVYGSSPAHFKMRHCCCLSCATAGSTSLLTTEGTN